jgi:hypothetical protein
MLNLKLKKIKITLHTNIISTGNCNPCTSLNQDSSTARRQMQHTWERERVKLSYTYIHIYIYIYIYMTKENKLITLTSLNHRLMQWSWYWCKQGKVMSITPFLKSPLHITHLHMDISQKHILLPKYQQICRKQKKNKNKIEKLIRWYKSYSLFSSADFSFPFDDTGLYLWHGNLERSHSGSPLLSLPVFSCKLCSSCHKPTSTKITQIVLPFSPI